MRLKGGQALSLVLDKINLDMKRRKETSIA